MGGGFGWTSRRFCYAADNLLSVDIVTADGERRHASDTENADLFWALRGGGGNFGAVTSFEFRAHHHGPQALCGLVVYPMGQASDVAQQFRRITATAGDELCCLLILRIAQPAFPPPGAARQAHCGDRRMLDGASRCWARRHANAQDVR
jgi:FAD/FMN-containing dehydrogenase